MAIDYIKSIVKDIEVGDIVIGKITHVTSFGVFAEIAPGKEAMCHISKLSDRRIERVTDILNVGDIATFQVTNIDDRGRIDLRKFHSSLLNIFENLSGNFIKLFLTA